MNEHFETANGAPEQSSEVVASEILGSAIESTMAMVGVGESDGINRAEHIPSKAEVDDMQDRTHRYLAGACTKADLTTGLEKGNLVAIMQFVAHEVENRGL